MDLLIFAQSEYSYYDDYINKLYMRDYTTLQKNLHKYIMYLRCTSTVFSCQMKYLILLICYNIFGGYINNISKHLIYLFTQSESDSIDKIDNILYIILKKDMSLCSLFVNNNRYYTDILHSDNLICIYKQY